MHPRTNETGDEQESHLGRNVAMGTAAALPWLSLIGRQRSRDLGAPTQNLDELLTQVRSGDIVLGGSTGNSAIKDLLASAMGSPDAYHTDVAIKQDGRMRRFGVTPGVGTDVADFNPAHRYTVLRPNLSDAELRQFRDNVRRFATGTTEVRAGGATVPFEGHTAVPTSAVYDSPQGVSAAVKELLLPKWNRYDAEGHAQMQREMLQLPNVAASIAEQIKATPNVTPAQAYEAVRAQGARGGVCSTVPATLLPPGHAVNPNKRVDEILPTDYLNSELFTPVGRYSPRSFTWRERLHQAGPTAARLGVGLAGAGLMYGGSKLIEYLRRPRDE